MTSEEMKNRKEVLLHLMSDPMYRPMRLREIAVFLNVPKSARKDLEEVLSALVSEGKIRVSGRGKYGKEKKQECAGLFIPSGRRTAQAEYAAQEHSSRCHILRRLDESRRP